MERYDVLIIGAGPGGLAAAKGAKEAGADRVLVLERDGRAGGILNQCIHDGFGLVRYKKQMTGPEYAVRVEKEAREAGAEILTGYQVVRITKEREVVAVGRNGLIKIQAGAIVLATGCRERTRGAISIPGSRPAGIYTAGVAQNLVNVQNIMPGRNVVILGSGDIGMIMARRLTLEGAKVKAVIEILPEPAGLARNVSQCLYDFNIPILCSHTVSRVIGEKRITGVEISQVDKEMKPIKGTEEIIDCDTLVLSVGLIPENEVAETAGVVLDHKTNGTITNEYMQTNISGIFSCGNSHKVMDLADFVSEQGELAGHNAVSYLNNQSMKVWNEVRSSSMKKGYPVEGSITCTLCPNGCQIEYDKVSNTCIGNRCKRGEEFAKQEADNPKRVVTTTVRVTDGEAKLLPVRSDKGVCKNNIFEMIQMVNKNPVSNLMKNREVIFSTTDIDGSVISFITTER